MITQRRLSSVIVRQKAKKRQPAQQQIAPFWFAKKNINNNKTARRFIGKYVVVALSQLTLQAPRHNKNDKIVLCCFHQIYLIEKRVKLKLFVSTKGWWGRLRSCLNVFLVCKVIIILKYILSYKFYLTTWCSVKSYDRSSPLSPIVFLRGSQEGVVGWKKSINNFFAFHYYYEWRFLLFMEIFCIVWLKRLKSSFEEVAVKCWKLAAKKLKENFFNFYLFFRSSRFDMELLKFLFWQKSGNEMPHHHLKKEWGNLNKLVKNFHKLSPSFSLLKRGETV